MNMNYEQATPRPWICERVPTSIGRCFKIGSEEQVNSSHGAICLYDDGTSLNPRTHEQAEADATLIVQAVNNFDALNAVAEAAEIYAEAGQCEGYHEDTSCTTCSAKEDLEKALANLAAIRAKEGK